MSDALINIDDFDGDQQPQQLPDKPLKDWRTKFEAGTLEAPSLMQYFQAASPYFLTIDKVTGSDNDLGECCQSIIALNSFHYKKTLPKNDFFIYFIEQHGVILMHKTQKVPSSMC